MIRFVAVVSLCLIGLGASAETCVSAQFDQPIPGASDVVSHVSDVPSAQFPVFWQTGELNGIRYKILASLEGTVQPIDLREDWEISLSCTGDETECDHTTTGTPPQSATTTAKMIGQCLLGLPLEPNPEVSEGIDTNAQQSPPTTPPAFDAPHDNVDKACGSDLVREPTEVAKLQRLLMLAGQDPGPVDGFLGPKTFSALAVFVEDAGWGTPLPAAIALLDEHLCAANPPSPQQAHG